MKTKSYVLVLSVTLALFSVTTYSNAQVIELESKALVTTEGELSKGNTMLLRWAESGEVACFPATRFREFRGNHVLYRIALPAYSNMKITVSPKSSKDRINLYALRLGDGNTDTPPEISRAIGCEAAYPIYAGNPNLRKASKPQSVEFVSIRNPYTILIGVAGAENVLSGAYELKIETQAR